MSDAGTAVISAAAIPINVPKITVGSNSMAAVFKSGLTKLGNKTVSRMSISVFGKGVVSDFVSDLGCTCVLGIKSGFENLSEEINQHVSLSGPYYWCAA